MWNEEEELVEEKGFRTSEFSDEADDMNEPLEDNDYGLREEELE